MRYISQLILIFVFVISCKSEQPNAQEIIDKTIEVSGGENYNQFDLEFDFRNRHYRVYRDYGTYQFERHFSDSLENYKDVVTNAGFKRFLNSEMIEVADSMAFKYTNSVNSVQYFALLPYGLNDAAVNKNYIGRSTIKGKLYHKVEVTFEQEGGGKDYEDIFVYWVNTDSFKVDYLAYSYITDGGGMRFREAYNERYVEGIRFVDYNNYKPNTKDSKLSDLDILFEADQLKLLSKIETENIVVKSN